jgi:hypothetical protein
VLAQFRGDGQILRVAVDVSFFDATQVQLVNRRHALAMGRGCLVAVKLIEGELQHPGVEQILQQLETRQRTRVLEKRLKGIEIGVISILTRNSWQLGSWVTVGPHVLLDRINLVLDFVGLDFSGTHFQAIQGLGDLIDNRTTQRLTFQGKKKGAEGGTDGLIFFQDDDKGAKKIIVSVKGGENVNRAMIADLKNTVEREKAEIGLFVSLAEPTQPMTTEAASAGFYTSPFGEFPKIQILTIEDLLSGKAKPNTPPDLSRGGLTFKKAKTEKERTEQAKLEGF